MGIKGKHICIRKNQTRGNRGIGDDGNTRRAPSSLPAIRASEGKSRGRKEPWGDRLSSLPLARGAVRGVVDRLVAKKQSVLPDWDSFSRPNCQSPIGILAT